MSLLRALALSGALAMAAGCGGGGTATEVARGDRPVMAFAELSTVSEDDALLSLRGPKGTVYLDFDGLERLGLDSVMVDEPFEKRTMEFRGVWIGDLVAAIGATADDPVRIHALDDYEVEFATSDLEGTSALLVTANGDGSRLDLAHGGPLRLVFTDASRVGSTADLWIWSIDQIVVG